MAEAMDPANQWAFDADVAPATDWAEKARRDAQDRYYKQYPDANRNGHVWGVAKRQAE
jgi:hypothetical protein